MSTMIQASAPTNIAGRYMLRLQRENFAKLEALVWLNTPDDAPIRIPNNAMLSPRRIARILQNEVGVRGLSAAPIADMIFKLMGDWRSEGFPDLTEVQPFTGRVGFWTIMLTYGDSDATLG